MQNLKDKQDKEFDERFIYDYFDNTGLKILGCREHNAPVSEYEIKQFLDKVRKETVECVCDKMIGKEYHPCPINSFDDGWNERIKEEKEIKKQIIKELK